MVINPEVVPYATSSPDCEIQQLLTDEWEHEFVLQALPVLR
jgi:hypothetical protein